MAKETGEKAPAPEERALARQQASENIETIVSECGVATLASIRSPLMQAIQLAEGMRRLKEALPLKAVEQYFIPLQGTPLGFITDKDRDGGYGPDVVREVVCEALMRGFHPIGNEFNIIAGRFYGAKAGFERIVREFPGVHSLDIKLGVPVQVGSGGALVDAIARWTYHGEPQELLCVEKDSDGMDTRIAVRVNSGMGPDAILGKATRKLFARIYQRLTGCSRDVVEMDPSDYVDAGASPGAARVAQQPEGRRMKLGARQPDPVPFDPETGEVPMREPGED